MVRPGQPPLTLERETILRNGRGRKTVRVRRGNRIVSDVTETLNATERAKIGRRRYVNGLYKKSERKTCKRLRGRKL
jgi:hypothetical protein